MNTTGQYHSIQPRGGSLEPYLGMIIPVAFNFAPRGWAQCNGQLMEVNQHQALFSLLGIQFGGDGLSTFALPDLRGRSPRGVLNQTGLASGLESIALTEEQLPAHNHSFNASQQEGAGRGTDPAGKVFATGTFPPATLYGQSSAPVSLSKQNIQPAGDSQAHDNMQPYLALNFIIALEGDYPAHS